MHRTRMKFCGMRSLPDIEAAFAAGADAVGFVFHRASRRHVEAQDVRSWLADAPPLLHRVFLFMDAPVSDVEEVLSVVQPDYLQFHGEESPEYCEQFALPWIKALPMGNPEQAESMLKAHASASMFLADSHGGAERSGGSGKTFDWDRIEMLPARTLIAGGLDPDNVGALVRQWRPWAVDVSSGIEDTPGCKSARRMEAFAQAVRRAEAEIEPSH